MARMVSSMSNCCASSCSDFPGGIPTAIDVVLGDGIGFDLSDVGEFEPSAKVDGVYAVMASLNGLQLYNAWTTELQ